MKDIILRLIYYYYIFPKVHHIENIVYDSYIEKLYLKFNLLVTVNSKFFMTNIYEIDGTLDDLISFMVKYSFVILELKYKKQINFLNTLNEELQKYIHHPIRFQKFIDKYGFDKYNEVYS
jgi:hypothetical protein